MSNIQKAQRDISIAVDRTLGETYEALASKYHVSKGTISNVLDDDQIKDVVSTGTRHLVSFIPLAVSRFFEILNDKKHKDNYKAIRDCLQTTGILASHTQSQTIVNIFNQQNTLIAPVVMDVLTKHEHEDVLDVDLGLDTNDILNNDGPA